MAGAPRLRLLVVESAPDPASVSIAAELRKITDWSATGERVDGAAVESLDGHRDVRLVRTPLLHLNAEPLEAAAREAGIPFDAVVFLSKHRAASGRPALTVHPIGNFGKAEFGGQSGRLSPSAPALQSDLLRSLSRHAAAKGYSGEVTFEVTHHGPLLTTPACFLELGSSEREWQDVASARIVGGALLDVARASPPATPIAVGLGGGHYGPRFTEAVLTRRVHFGHMIPTHAAERLDSAGDMLDEALRATPGAGGVYAHRKMLDRKTFDRWSEAMKARGVPWIESDSWEPLTVPSVPDNSG